MNGMLGQLPAGLRGMLGAQQLREQSNQNQLGQLGGILSLQGAMQNQAIQQEGLRQKQLQQQRVTAFAEALPVDERPKFLLDPSGYIKNLNEGYTLGPGQQRFRNGTSVASVPDRPSLVNVPVDGRPGVTQPTWLVPGKDSGIPVGGLNMPEILNKEVQQAKSAVAAAGKPSINVRVDTKTGESLAKEIGPMLAESRAGAMGAIGTIDAANRIGAALDQGNVTLGPTATVRNKIDQFSQILGAGGETTEERLVNTRNTMRGLAQFAVGARKALKGQGTITDNEQKLIERAEAGNIDDFTVPELRNFVGVTRKLAEQTYGEHKRMMEVMNQNPELRGISPFYSVPDLPQAPQPKPTPKPGAGGWGIRPVNN